MGILFVLAFWGGVGLVLATVGTLAARGVVTLLTRNPMTPPKIWLEPES